MDMELAQRMLDVVARIPAGSVATYGDVAARAGSRSPRLAGFVLAQLSDDDTPWHRVLRANGTPAPHLAAEQLHGCAPRECASVDGRVDLQQVPVALTLTRPSRRARRLGTAALTRPVCSHDRFRPQHRPTRMSEIDLVAATVDAHDNNR